MPIDPFQQLQMFNRVVQQISMLRQANTPHGAAPHKPVLLLSLIDYIEEVGLTDNRFPISERLGDIFIRNWNLVVDTKNKCDITLPLFHLQNDHLWRLVSAYRIMVKDAKTLNESGDPTYSLQVLKGRSIALPHESRFRPDLDKLRDHRMRWGFQ